MNFVIFNDSKAFKCSKLWLMQDIKSKYRDTTITPIQFAFVDVKAGNKILQRGILVMSENENEAMKIYNRIKDLKNA